MEKTNITELEAKMIRAIGTNEFADEPGDSIWSFSIIDSNEDKGVLGSLTKKGIVTVSHEKGENEICCFTDEGLALYNELNVS